jgi:hypothetical protein
MSEYCMRCGNFLCYCEEIKKAEQPHAYKTDKDEQVTLTLGQLSVLVKQAQEDEREACALICENMERNGNWITKEEAASAIRAGGIDGATVGEVGVWGDTAPPKREWVGLTRRELDIATLNLEDLEDCYIAIEAKLKEKNT